jgi:hypothetical protein
MRGTTSTGFGTAASHVMLALSYYIVEDKNYTLFLRNLLRLVTKCEIDGAL